MVEIVNEKRDLLQRQQERGEKREEEEEDERREVDILETLVRAHDDEHGSLTDKELIHNINTFFIAGHETTAGSLSLLLHMLAQYPNHQQRCFDEILEVCPEGRPTDEHLKQFKFLEAFIKETMRLFPPAFMIARETEKDLTLGGFHIPKGMIIAIQVFALHRNPELWDNPDVFQPDRFLDPLKRDTFVYLPFSKGSRMCIGVNFAMMEIKTLLVQLLHSFEFYSDPSDPPFRLRLAAVTTVDSQRPLRFRLRSP